MRVAVGGILHESNTFVAQPTGPEAFLGRLVPEGDPIYTHVAEGDDDMPSHVKAALTRTSEQVPVRGGALALGIWQGIYVWEHRRGRHSREVVVHVVGAA